MMLHSLVLHVHITVSKTACDNPGLRKTLRMYDGGQGQKRGCMVNQQHQEIGKWSAFPVGVDNWQLE
jgi:hypothetical protein